MFQCGSLLSLGENLKNNVFPPPASPGRHTVFVLKSPVEQFCQLCGVGVDNDMLTMLLCLLDVSYES